MQREEQAVVMLATMEQKLKKGPSDALGLDVFATPDEVRQAFLNLTKLYHPNRFARFSRETQRRANTVFVAIKRAHDDFAKVGRPSGNLNQGRPSDPTLGRPSSGAIVQPSLAKIAKPPSAASPPRTATSTQQPPTVAAAARSRRPSAVPQWLPQGASRPKSTSSPNPGSGTSAGVRNAGLPGVAPAHKPSSVGSGSGQTPMARPNPVSRPSGPTPSAPAKPVVEKSPEELKFDEAKLAANQQRWTDAEALFGELAVTQPQEKKFRVFRHYVRGRLAQEENRISDARQEYERALTLDATFASARIALGQLPAGGFLGRLFKR